MSDKPETITLSFELTKENLTRNIELLHKYYNFLNKEDVRRALDKAGIVYEKGYSHPKDDPKYQCFHKVQ